MVSWEIREMIGMWYVPALVYFSRQLLFVVEGEEDGGVN